MHPKGGGGRETYVSQVHFIGCSYARRRLASKAKSNLFAAYLLHFLDLSCLLPALAYVHQRPDVICRRIFEYKFQMLKGHSDMKTIKPI